MFAMEPDNNQPAYQPTLLVTVMIATTDAPGASPGAAWMTEVAIAEADRDALVTQVRSLVSGADHRPHIFRHDGGQTSWGGAGEEFYNVAIYVGSHAADAAFGAAAAALLESLRARFRRRNDWPGRLLGRAEAAEYARRSIERGYRNADRFGYEPIEVETLELIGDEHDAKTDEWAIRFRARNGDTFEVRVALQDGFPAVTTMRRDRRAE